MLEIYIDDCKNLLHAVICHDNIIILDSELKRLFCSFRSFMWQHCWLETSRLTCHCVLLIAWPPLFGYYTCCLPLTTPPYLGDAMALQFGSQFSLDGFEPYSCHAPPSNCLFQEGQWVISCKLAKCLPIQIHANCPFSDDCHKFHNIHPLAKPH